MGLAMQLVTMKCPKCGHSQEERLDCVRCGIVFAKYYAMYPQAADLPPENQETLFSPHPAPADALLAEVSELRQGVREIASRLTDVEFERAERNLLRGEIKSVEQKVNELAEDLKNRVSALEEYVSNPDPTQVPESGPATAIEEMLERLAQIERQVEALTAQTPPQDMEMAEMIREISTRQDGLEGRLDELIAGFRQKVEASQSSGKDLAELRQAVQSATVRYSEIGDLKKNHLVLQNEIETLRRDQENLRNQPSNGTAARLSQIESEVAALRAELRQALKRLESTEAEFSAQLQEARSCRPAGPDSVAISSALARVDANLKEDKAAWLQQKEFFSSEMRRFEDWNQSVSTGLQETNDGLKEACRCIEGLVTDIRVLKQESMQLRTQVQALQEQGRETRPRDSADQPPAVETDLHDIREGMEQIRVFMQNLARKL
jgi:chromosome segregation ATPase